MHRIIVFKDQLIDDLNHEVHKLQKDLADFSILSDFEGIPAGHYLRHKFGSLNSTDGTPSCTTSSPSSEKQSSGLDESVPKPTKDNVDLLIENNAPNQLNNDMKRIFLYSQMSSNQITIENIKNLPDLTMNLDATVDESIYVNSSEDDFKSLSSSQEILSQDNGSLNGQNLLMGKETEEEHQNLMLELQKCKENEAKWEQEKQKILIYQQQLQKKYLEVLGKTEELEEKLKDLSNKGKEHE